jgi:hypothetical protein
MGLHNTRMVSKHREKRLERAGDIMGNRLAKPSKKTHETLN